jgi:hypothetical protein
VSPITQRNAATAASVSCSQATTIAAIAGQSRRVEAAGEQREFFSR